jgi:D-glycero-D-manno-heptose 1,7-bisphosphate phosphatase
MMGRKRSPDLAADEYIHNLATKKQELNEAFLKKLKSPEVNSAAMTFPLTKAAMFDATTWVMFHPVYDDKQPGLLIDLDGTVVTAEGGWPKALGQQYALENRHNVLRKCKEAGFIIIGVTNRAVYPGDEEDFTAEDVQSINEETMEIFGDLIDDVIYIPYGKSSCHKPSPVMINYALTYYNLDINCSVFVGDSDDDREAAMNAGVNFIPAEDFFK